MSSSDTTDGRTRVKEWLATRRAAGWIVGVAVLFVAPSLTSGLVADDYLHALTLRGLPFPQPQSGKLDLFRFANGDVRTAKALMDLGQFPWPADPTCRFAFFRPLAALTHVLDYALWPSSPLSMHAQNIAWFALAMVGVAAAYRRFLGATWVAGLALLFYALDDTHGQAVGWIANRNALLALALSLPVLVLHDSWRTGARKGAGWLGAALFGVALFAGESALAIGAYLAAYAVHLDRGAWKARAASLVPYGLVAAVWRAIYVKLGYGVSGSGIYLDPGQHPLAFLRALPHRLPFLLLGDFAFPRSDLAEVYDYVSPTAMTWMVGVAVVLLAVLAVTLAPLVKRDPVARFFATGLLLASLPICAAFPCDRVLLFVSIGGMGLVAQLVATAEGLASRVVATFLMLVHLVINPALLPIKAHFLFYDTLNDMADRTIPSTPDVTDKTVVLMNPPNDLFYVYVPSSRMVRGEPLPAHLRGIAPVTTWVDVTRVDDRTLRVHPEDGFIEQEPERMLRSLDRPIRVGSSVELPGLSITVTASMPDGRPAEALFRFDRPLEDRSFVWEAWTPTGYGPWVPPALGDRARLPAHDVRRAVLDLADHVQGSL